MSTVGNGNNLGGSNQSLAMEEDDRSPSKDIERDEWRRRQRQLRKTKEASEEGAGKDQRIPFLRTITAVMLLFTMSNFVREYMDVSRVRRNFFFDSFSRNVSSTELQENEYNFEMSINSDTGSSTSPRKSTSPYKDGYLPLHELVRVDENVECPQKDLLPIQSVHNPLADLGQGRKIPQIVHITGKHKCSTKQFVDAAVAWTWPNHSFYYHDDEAVEKLLFGRSWPEFPQLQNSWECLKNAGGAARADLWRYVALWEYGGIYTDMDNLPGSLLNASTITPDIDAFFLQERGGFLSQFFFAVAPRHPLMFLAVHDVMEQMHSADDIGKMYIPVVTGPGTTKRSFIRFMGGTSQSSKEFLDKYGYPTNGTYFGKFGTNRSVTVVGSRSTGHNWVQRSALGSAKARAWNLMNVSDYQAVNKVASGQTCLMKLHEWHAEQRQQFVEEGLHRWRW